MSVSARVRAPVTYREWLAQAEKLYGEAWSWACECYSFKAAFVSGMTPEQAVQDCKGWLYG